MRPVIREACGYLGASALALGVDMGVLVLLVEHASMPALPAACISFSAGVLVCYALSVSFVFTHRRIRRRPLEFASFAALGALGFLVNAAVMALGIRLLGLHYLIAKLAAALCTFVANFLARRQLLFVPANAIPARAEDG